MQLTATGASGNHHSALSRAIHAANADRPIPEVPPVDPDQSPPAGSVDEPLVGVPAAIGTARAYDGTDGLYGCHPPLVRAGVATKLVEAQHALPAGLQLVILDAWRSLDFQKQLVTHYGTRASDDGFVSSATNPQFVPPHVSGGAVDVSLSAGFGPLALGSGFDEFTSRAELRSLEHMPASVERSLRRVLFWAMTSSGFAPYRLEWWHFSYGDQNWAAYFGLPASLYGPAGDISYKPSLHEEKLSAYRRFLEACDREEVRWTAAGRERNATAWPPLDQAGPDQSQVLQTLEAVELRGSDRTKKCAKILVDWFAMARITLEQEMSSRRPNEEAFDTDRDYYRELRDKYIEAVRQDIGGFSQSRV